MDTEEEHKPFLSRFNGGGLRRMKQENRTCPTRYKQQMLNALSQPLAVVALTSLIWASLYLFLHVWSGHSAATHNAHEDWTIKSHSRFSNCGKSVSEAESLGCSYDILSNHWVPNQCMDDQAVKWYQEDGSWFGYADENRTEMVDVNAMGNMGIYYTSMRDHIVHCAILWKKQFAAFYGERGYYDSLIVDPEHTNHCVDFLIDMTDHGVDFRKIPIKVEVGFAGCWVQD